MFPRTWGLKHHQQQWCFSLKLNDSLKKGSIFLRRDSPSPISTYSHSVEATLWKAVEKCFFSALMPARPIEVAFRLLSHAARKILAAWDSERVWRHRLYFPAESCPEKVCSRNYSLHLPFLLFGVRLKAGKKEALAFRIAFIRSCPGLPVYLVYFALSTLFCVVRSFMCCC